MKKRDKYWLYKIVLVTVAVVLFIVVSIYNIVQLNGSYISEEKAELEIFRKQIEWAINPILKNNDTVRLQKYCKDFKNDKEFAFRIFDENKNLLATSAADNDSKIAPNDIRFKIKYNLWDLYKRSFSDKSLENISEIDINGKKYLLEISISEKFVIESIMKAQKNILILFGACFIFLILFIIRIFSSVRSAFNNFEDSVVEIAKGNLDAKIKVPDNGLLNELAQSVSDMTKKLKLQIERMKKLEEYKTEFIQNITHEIKTPITAINSAIEIIEDNNKISTNDKECFDIIKNQTISINKLVEDILALSETDLKKTEEIKNFEQLELYKVVKEAIEAQGPIDCKINVTDSDIIINANKKLLIMAISNLLGNSIKYSGSDKIDINLSKDDEHTEIEIKDYGIGIDKKHLSRIFERFYRIDKARSRKTGGTGLGLSIVKNIVEIHNWQIEVESEVNKGTSFKIII